MLGIEPDIRDFKFEDAYIQNVIIIRLQIIRQKKSGALVLNIDVCFIWSFRMLGNEPAILDFKFKDDTSLSLWTDQKVRKTGSASKKGPKAENQNCEKWKWFSIT